MPVLSIQSRVAYGHVGNAAAVFPLQRLGREVWPVDTVTFSNHPAYGGWR
ncbi:MAG: pyridoxal kinase, partial [Alphaproteobacteria bacterium]